MEPELAESWKLQDAGKRIDFVLRKGIRFSDGTPFDAEDVMATFRRMNDPAVASSIADEVPIRFGADENHVERPLCRIYFFRRASGRRRVSFRPVGFCFSRVHLRRRRRSSGRFTCRTIKPASMCFCAGIRIIGRQTGKESDSPISIRSGSTFNRIARMNCCDFGGASYISSTNWNRSSSSGLRKICPRQLSMPDRRWTPSSFGLTR